MRVSPSQAEGTALVVEFYEVAVAPFLQPILVPLEGTLVSECLYYTPPRSVSFAISVRLNSDFSVRLLVKILKRTVPRIDAEELTFN